MLYLQDFRKIKYPKCQRSQINLGGLLVVYYQELSLLSRSNTLTPLTLIYDHINRTLTISDVIKLPNECHQWHSLTISSAIKPLNECHQSTF